MGDNTGHNKSRGMFTHGFTDEGDYVGRHRADNTAAAKKYGQNADQDAHTGHEATTTGTSDPQAPTTPENAVQDDSDTVTTPGNNTDTRPATSVKILTNISHLGIIIAVFIVGLVFYQTTYSGWRNNMVQSNLSNDLHDNTWKTHPGEDQATSINPDELDVEPLHANIGDPIGELRIPKLGVNVTIVEGVGKNQIAKGPGHFPGSNPGEKGNFALAGHRIGQGSHFNRIGELTTCDTVDLETADRVYHYQVTGNGTGDCFTDAEKSIQKDYGVPATRIVTPTDYGVTDPIPWVESQTAADDEPHGTPKGRWLTMVTCNPEWGNWERLVTQAQLTSVTEK